MGNASPKILATAIALWVLMRLTWGLGEAFANLYLGMISILSRQMLRPYMGIGKMAIA